MLWSGNAGCRTCHVSLTGLIKWLSFATKGSSLGSRHRTTGVASSESCTRGIRVSVTGQLRWVAHKLSSQWMWCRVGHRAGIPPPPLAHQQTQERKQWKTCGMRSGWCRERALWSSSDVAPHPLYCHQVSYQVPTRNRRQIQHVSQH